MHNFIYLTLAIICEVIATSMLKMSEGFTRGLPTIISIIGYIGAFYLLSLTLQTIPVGIAYAIWSGVGIVLISIIAWLVMHQSLDLPAIIGMLFIIVGVIIINLFSSTVKH